MPHRNWAMISENSANTNNPSSHNTSEKLYSSGTGGPYSNPTRSQTSHKNEYLAVGGNQPATSVTSTNGIAGRLKRIPSSIRSGSAYRSRSSSASMRNDGHFPLHFGEEGAGTLHRAAGTHHGMAGDGSIDVMIRVEIDQHDKEGKTAAYGLQIPLLHYKAAMPPLIMRSSEVLVEHKQIGGDNAFVPTTNLQETSDADLKVRVIGDSSNHVPITRIGHPYALRHDESGRAIPPNKSEGTEYTRLDTYAKNNRTSFSRIRSTNNVLPI